MVFGRGPVRRHDAEGDLGQAFSNLNGHRSFSERDESACSSASAAGPLASRLTSVSTDFLPCDQREAQGNGSRCILGLLLDGDGEAVLHRPGARSRDTSSPAPRRRAQASRPKARGRDGIGRLVLPRRARPRGPTGRPGAPSACATRHLRQRRSIVAAVRAVIGQCRDSARRGPECRCPCRRRIRRTRTAHRLRRILGLDQDGKQHLRRVDVGDPAGILVPVRSGPAHFGAGDILGTGPVEPGRQPGFARIAPIGLETRIEGDLDAGEPMVRPAIPPEIRRARE